ncbi:MAG TPA: hypothetical protein VG328_18165 [Stellaceae bacterium]|jgi:hypothetical protein|nr:hypothetical protein [Stellaceae bacterium]
MPSQSRRTRRLPPLPPPSRLDRRYLGISGRYWLITCIALGLSFGIYKVSNPVTPNAFDQPGAQIPNQLRSPWGVKNPL